jgi:hypothetical protein
MTILLPRVLSSTSSLFERMIRLRDLNLMIDQGLPLPDAVIVRGRIVDVHRTRSRIFIQLSDPTGNIQVVSENLECRPSPGAMWEFEGSVDLLNFRNRNEPAPRPTIVAMRFEDLTGSGQGDQGPRDNTRDVHQRFLERGVSLARLRALGTTTFERLGFIEVEPKLITLTAPLTGLEPMQVSYVGFGAPAHLFPSPARQLKQILEGTSVRAVFAVSRIFTTTFRDESTSYEALTLMAMAVGHGGLSDTGATVLERAIAMFAKDPQLNGVLRTAVDPTGRLATIEVSGAPRPLVKPVTSTTLESYSDPSHYMAEPGGSPPTLFQRLIAPERTILAERAIMPWFGSETLEVTTIHLERLSALFFDTHGRPLTVVSSAPSKAKRNAR